MSEVDTERLKMLSEAAGSNGMSKLDKKVLIVARPSAGGMRRHIEGLLKYLPLHGYDAAVSGFDFISDRPTPITDIRAVRHLRSLAEHFPMLHAHGIRAGWICAVALRNHKPWLWTIHHLLMEKSPLMRSAIRWIAKQSRCVIAVSRAVEKGIVTTGVPNSKVEMIHGGIDVALFSSLPNRQDARNAVFASDDKPVILLAGRFAPEKGFDVVIQSMEIVWQKVPEAELWLAGEGPENSRLVMLQAKASRPGQIRFFGYWSEIGQMYAAADVFVAPSRREGQGLSILEAMHCGLPVIATKVGGLVEMVQDGQTGLLVPVQDSEAIGHAIVRLLTDQELVQQITSRAREAVKRFDMNQVAGEIAARYDKWLSQGG